MQSVLGKEINITFAYQYYTYKEFLHVNKTSNKTLAGVREVWNQLDLCIDDVDWKLAL